MANRIALKDLQSLSFEVLEVTGSKITTIEKAASKHERIEGEIIFLSSQNGYRFSLDWVQHDYAADNIKPKNEFSFIDFLLSSSFKPIICITGNDGILSVDEHLQILTAIAEKAHSNNAVSAFIAKHSEEGN